ncbi:MAG: M48 family metallopeptidase [Phycisphaerales bacterium JB050]
MFDPIIILYILTIALRDSTPNLLTPPQVSPLVLGVFICGVLIGLIASTYLLNALALRAFDRTGSRRVIQQIDRLSSISKFLLAAHWISSVFWLDWLGIVRSGVGDVVLLDELLAVLPFLFALFALYGLGHGIQTRLQEAVMARWLDQGLPIPSPPSYAVYVIEAIRHRAAIILVPVCILTATSEGLERLFARLTLRYPEYAESEWSILAPELAQLVLAGGVLCLMPILLRCVWRTSSLPQCRTRQRLETMCREQGVRVRDILVWHTRSGMLNGALIGVLPWVRYILLTEALIERLPGEQLEAVMAHEIAHARRHHLPWLLGAMVGVVTVCTTGLWLLLRPTLMQIEDHQQRMFWSDTAVGLSIGVALVCAFFLFGWISRKFERQADAFATQHLSGVRFNRRHPHPTDRCQIISGRAANAMQQALATVAESSGMRPERFTFRHGSIAGRQRAIGRLVGRPALRLPIDRVVWRIKAATVLVLGCAVAVSAVQWNIEQAEREEAKARADAIDQVVDQWLRDNGLHVWFTPSLTPETDREP